MKKILLIMFLFMIPLAFAIDLNCTYDDTPYIVSEITKLENKIMWICDSSISDYSCLTIIEKQGEYLQINPIQKKVDGIGIIDTFQSNGKIITVHFTPEANIILGGEEYNFSAYCGNGSHIFSITHNVTPVYRDDLNFIIARGIWLRDNWGYIIVGGLIVILVIIALGLIWHKSKQ